MRVPRSVYAAHDDAQRQAIVILDDLDTLGATFCRVQRPLTYDQAAAQLDTLASLHAQWWESAEFEPGGPLAWIDALDPLPEGTLGTYQRSRLQPEVYAECMALPRGVAVSRSFHDRDRMERAMERLRSSIGRDRSACCIRIPISATYLDRDGPPGLLDWQSVRKGPWSHDLNYFLVSSLDMLDRRAWERALLQHYLDALRARGVTPPTFDAAWQAYRAQTVYGLYYWLVNPGRVPGRGQQLRRRAALCVRRDRSRHVWARCSADTGPGMSRVAYTSCRICAGQCGLRFELDEAGAGHVSARRRANPVTLGYACSKGITLPEAHRQSANVCFTR